MGASSERKVPPKPSLAATAAGQRRERRAWLEQWRAPNMEEMALNSTSWTLPWKWGLRTIWRAVAAWHMRMLLSPRLSPLQAYCSWCSRLMGMML